MEINEAGTLHQFATSPFRFIQWATACRGTTEIIRLLNSYPQNYLAKSKFFILSGLSVVCGTQPAEVRQRRASAAGGCGPRGSFRAAISTE